MPQSLAITSSSRERREENRHPFSSDIGRSSDGERSQPWEAGQQGDARIGNPRALPELDFEFLPNPEFRPHIHRTVLPVFPLVQKHSR